MVGTVLVYFCWLYFFLYRGVSTYITRFDISADIILCDKRSILPPTSDNVTPTQDSISYPQTILLLSASIIYMRNEMWIYCKLNLLKNKKSQCCWWE